MARAGAVLAGTGEWIGVSGGDVVALLPPQAADLAARLWVALDDEVGLEQALDVVLRQGLGAVPSMALVETLAEGRLRLLLRGTPRAEVEIAASPGSPEVVIHREGVWTERLVDGAVGVRVSCGAGDDATASPLQPGLRRVGWVEVRVADDAVAEVEAPLVDLVEPEPVPEVEPEAVGPVLVQASVPSTSEGGTETAPFAAFPLSEQLGAEPDEPPAARPAAPSLAEALTDVLAPSPVVAAAPAPGGEAIGPRVITPDAPPHWQEDMTSHLAPVAAVGEDAATTDVLPSPATPPPTRVQPPARLTFSHGLVVELDRPFVVGRAPAARPGQPDARTVVVPSPLGEVSGSHVEIRPGQGRDAGRVVLLDLGSTNGTVVLRRGQPPLDLLPGAPLVLTGEAVVDLGDGATVTVHHH